MSKPENDETWSTWEELLLACAVHRHGIDSWHSVAAEIHKRNSSSRTLTALDCRRKYHDLKRRFSPEGDTVADISSVPWLEELRKLRVDELRREVERYDLSISSLQLKVKRLEDEREKSLKEETESPDLVKITETKDNRGESGEKFDVPVIEPNRIGVDRTDEKPVREDSGTGSCESVGKETSDVQSSASLPRKEETVEHDQPDNEDQSLTVNKTLFESGPLIDFVEILRSHPIGSHFSRRLESQETPEYERIIRQHIDLDLIRTRVDEGYYESSITKFYRDLQLLINNAKVFYGEQSSEYSSATQLHQLIKKQMTLKTSNQAAPPKEESLVTSKEELTLLSLQTKVSVSVKACRKRSSLAVRSSVSATEPFKKKTKVVPMTDENEKKPVPETEEEDETTDKDEEPIVSKKMSRGKKVGSRNVKTSLDDGSSEQKKNDQEKKGKSTNVGSKKQSAASFLKRMKGASPSETVKDNSSSGKKGAEHRTSNTKHEKVDAGQKRATGKKTTTPAKKNTSAASKREASEKEEGSSTRLKKRTRRL